jgi:hypothetical protein
MLGGTLCLLHVSDGEDFPQLGSMSRSMVFVATF